MAAGSAGLHEPVDKLKPDTPDLHRAIVSLMEELEAFDWYRQRADACVDDQLRAILEHNMNEEIEHASMVLEWIRRKVPKVDDALKTYLFTSGDVTQIEAKIMSGSSERNAYEKSQTRTTIGDLKGR